MKFITWKLRNNKLNFYCLPVGVLKEFPLPFFIFGEIFLPILCIFQNILKIQGRLLGVVFWYLLPGAGCVTCDEFGLLFKVIILIR